MRGRRTAGAFSLLMIGLAFALPEGAEAQRVGVLRAQTGAWNAEPLALEGMDALAPLTEPARGAFDPAEFDPRRPGQERYAPVDRSLRRGRFEDAALVLRGLASRASSRARGSPLLGAVSLEGALGQEEAALAAAEALLEGREVADPEARWRATALAADLHLRRGEPGAALARHRAFLRSRAPLALRLRAHLGAVEAALAAGQERAARLLLRRALREARRAARAASTSAPLSEEARRAAAELHFLHGQRLHEAYGAVSLAEYRGDECDLEAIQRWAEGPFLRWITRARRAQERALAAYAEVYPMGDPRWSQAALVRSAETYLEMVRAIQQAPDPFSPACGTGDLRDLYTCATEPSYRPLERRAEALLAQAAALAHRHRLYGAWSRRAFALLTRLDPLHYPAGEELWARAPLESGPVAPPPLR